MQPAQPDRPVSTIYNNIIGEGRAAPAAPDPSLDHFWRVLFGHFPKTVVKFIKKAPTKTTSKMVPMANSLAFWRRAGTTLYRVPSRHPGSQRMVFSKGASVPQRGAPHGCSQPGMPQQDPRDGMPGCPGKLGTTAHVHQGGVRSPHVIGGCPGYRTENPRKCTG